MSFLHTKPQHARTSWRFSLGVLLLAPVYLAVLWTVLAAFGAPLQVTVAMLLMVLWVGWCQLMLGDLCRPRIVSPTAGGFFAVVWTIWMTQLTASYPAFAATFPAVFVVGGFYGFLIGQVHSLLMRSHEYLAELRAARRYRQERLQSVRGKPPRESPFDD